jgi:surfeit locus 1 family protein
VTSAYRRFLVPGVSTFVMLIVLIGLGTWQIDRLQWKAAILAQIAAAEAAPAAPLTPDPAPYTPPPYTKVSATGRFRFDRTAQYGSEVRDTRTGPTIGFHQIVPLSRPDAPTILVDRGWVPQTRTAGLDDPDGEVTVTGYVQPADRAHWFSAPDDAAARQFFTLDPHAIAAALGLTDAAPFTIVALGASRPETYPAPAENLPRPPNNHLSYVITWYGLAVALAVIFGVWVRKALRS